MLLLCLSGMLGKLKAFIEGSRSLQDEEWPITGPLVCLDGGFCLLIRSLPSASFSVRLVCRLDHIRNLKEKAFFMRREW